MSRSTSVFIGPILRCEVSKWPELNQLTRCSANEAHHVEDGYSFCPICGAPAKTELVETDSLIAFTTQNIDSDDYEDDFWKEKGIDISDEDYQWLLANFTHLRYDEDTDEDIVGFIGGRGFFVDADDDETEEQNMNFRLPNKQETERLKKLMKYGNIKSLLGTNVSVYW